MRLASVVLDIPTQALDRCYTYRVPDELTELSVGSLVQVPFGGRQAFAYVMRYPLSPDEALQIDGAKLKDIVACHGGPYFDERGAACALYLSQTYVAPLSACVRLFAPPGATPKLVKRAGEWLVEKPAISAVDDRWLRLLPAAQNYQPRVSAIKQRALIGALSQGELRMTELALEFGALSSTVKALEARGVIEVFKRRRLRLDEQMNKEVVRSKKPVFTVAQKEALAVIEQAQAQDSGQVVLLDGVTGSGKTEVYLQAIEDCLNRGENALVLVPEISLTPQTVARFRGRFGTTVAVMHSRMGQGERFDQWELINAGHARVVVGARSALFVPLKQVGLIVIDEAHEGSYKQDQAPRYDAVAVAEWMMKQTGGLLILGSATPRFEHLHACQNRKDWQQVRLMERTNGKALPPIEIVDMAREFSQGHRSMFSRRLQAELFATIEAGYKAVLLLNQRGFAQFVLCRDCGYVPKCPHCETSLTYHEHGSFLKCHHCNYQQSNLVSCPCCNSPYIKKFGAGTQRVEAELHALLAEHECTIVRMDADTTRKKGAHQRLLEEFAAAKSAVLLGTQMIAKGLDFQDVTLVGVINADTQLHLPDFRAHERTFALIEQVAGRAGRSELSGRVLVQTYSAEEVCIRAAAHYDRELLLNDDLPKRAALHYPPYARLANVLIWGKDEQTVKQEARKLTAELEEFCANYLHTGWEILPATSCILGKLRTYYRYHILVKAPPGVDLGVLLEPFFRQRKHGQSVFVAVDIDPWSLL